MLWYPPVKFFPNDPIFRRNFASPSPKVLWPARSASSKKGRFYRANMTTKKTRTSTSNSLSPESDKASRPFLNVDGLIDFYRTSTPIDALESG
jgi:hypothetical protein